MVNKTYGLYPSHDALRVPTLLGVVAPVCTPLPTRTQQLPTLLAQQCRELLCPFARSLNQMRFSKTFFTFKFFSEYSCKLANLLWHKLKVIFYCQSYDVIFALKTVKTKNPNTHGCWEYKVLLSSKVSAQTVKNCKTSLKEITLHVMI